VTQSDVFEYFRTERKTPNLQNKVHYMLRLPIAELNSKNRYPLDRRSSWQEDQLWAGGKWFEFQRLGVQVEQALIDQQSAFQKLQSGRIAATGTRCRKAG
jgi:hypothetical protein